MILSSGPPEGYRVVRRFVGQVAGSQAVPASQNTVSQQPAGVIQLPAMEPQQALRIISATATLTDVGNTHFLTVINASLQLRGATLAGISTGPLLRNWVPPSSPSIIGATGETWGVTDDELLLGTDYQELALPGGFVPGRFVMFVIADLSNSDAAPHNITSTLITLVEFYQRKF